MDRDSAHKTGLHKKHVSEAPWHRRERPAMQEFADGAGIPRPFVVCISGVPGVGKTTLSRGLLIRLCGTDNKQQPKRKRGPSKDTRIGLLQGGPSRLPPS